MQPLTALFLALLLCTTPALASNPVVIVHNGSVQGVLGAQSDGVQAKTIAQLARLRKVEPDLLLLSCGNMLGPSVTSDFDGGALALKLMNDCAYDAMAIGPHDLFAGVQNMLNRARAASFSFVCSNVKVSGALAKRPGWTRIRKQVRLDCQGRSVQVFGVIEPSAVENWPQWSSELELAPIKETLGDLKEQADGASLVVVLGTMTFATGLSILDDHPWVDLVIAHPAAGEAVPSSSTFVNQLLDGRLLIWSACHGAHIARVEARVDGERVICQPQAIELTETMPDSLAALAEIDALEEKARSAGGKRLATLSVEEQKYFARLLLNGLRYELGAEVSIIHTGALRQKTAPEKLSRRVLSATFPFPDRVALVSVDGATLKSIYERRNDVLINSSGLEIVGMGECSGSVLVNGRPINNEERYRVATTEFLALGGLSLFPKNPSTVRPQRLVDLLAEHFKSIPDTQRSKRHRSVNRRAISRARTTLDFSMSSVDFYGSAPTYQYNEPNATFTSSDIPGLVGLEHKSYSYSLHHRNVIDWPHADLTFDLKLNYSTFKQFKTVDRSTFEMTYEDQSCSQKPHLFGNLNLTGTVQKPAVLGRDRPLFAKAVTGLVWKLDASSKLFAGFGHLKRLSVQGDPGNTGLDLRYTFAKKIRSKVELSTDLDLFGSFDSADIRTLDWSTSLRFELGGNLSTVFKNTTFLWKDDLIDDTATRRDLYIGIGYDVKFRRF